MKWRGRGSGTRRWNRKDRQLEEESVKDKVRKEELEKTWRGLWEKSMEIEENERRSECEKQRIKEDETRKEKLEVMWKKQFEQKLENDKRDKLREWEEERKEDVTRREQLEETWRGEWEEERKEDVTRRKQLEETWRRESEKKMESEKRGKQREGEEDRMKNEEARKKELERNWRREWEKMMDSEEKERKEKDKKHRNERQWNWETAITKAREQEHERISREKASLAEIKERREEDRERAARNEKRETEEKEWMKHTDLLLWQQNKLKDIMTLQRTLDELHAKHQTLTEEVQMMELVVSPSPLTPLDEFDWQGDSPTAPEANDPHTPQDDNQSPQGQETQIHHLTSHSLVPPTSSSQHY